MSGMQVFCYCKDEEEEGGGKYPHLNNLLGIRVNGHILSSQSIVVGVKSGLGDNSISF